MSGLDFFSFFIAMGLTLFFIFIAKPIAIKINLVDVPGGRKAHEGNIPLIGGIALFLGFAFACLTLDISMQVYRSLFAGGALLVLVGVGDDFHEFSARTRLAVQLFVSLLMVYWGKIYVAQLGHFFFLGDFKLGWFGIVLTVVAMMGLINAKNMLDGVDGLAGGLSVIELSFLCFIAYHAGRVNDARMIFLLMGAALAFLFFNFPFLKRGASIFMGDAGSMFLGFFLTWFCISLSQNHPYAAANPVTFVWIMAVPIFDLVMVIIRRLRNKRSPFKPDREHIHHILERMGFNSRGITLLLCGFSCVMGFVGVVLNTLKIPGALGIIPFVCFFLIFYYWTAKVIKRYTHLMELK